jgi:hypothetical protein
MAGVLGGEGNGNAWSAKLVWSALGTALTIAGLAIARWIHGGNQDLRQMRQEQQQRHERWQTEISQATRLPCKFDLHGPWCSRGA